MLPFVDDDDSKHGQGVTVSKFTLPLLIIVPFFLLRKEQPLRITLSVNVHIQTTCKANL